MTDAERLREIADAMVMDDAEYFAESIPDLRRIADSLEWKEQRPEGEIEYHTGNVHSHDGKRNVTVYLEDGRCLHYGPLPEIPR